MNKKKITLIAFIIVAIAQIVLVAGLIIRYETVLKYGKEFKFKTEPIDPYDAFRGRYVAVKVKAGNVPCKDAYSFNLGEEAYALISIDKEGFAEFADLKHEKPDNGIDYLKVKVLWERDENEVCVETPFKRFYMEESDAGKAESIYRKYNTGDGNAYLVVRILAGNGVIENLMIDGTPVSELIKEQNEK